MVLTYQLYTPGDQYFLSEDHLMGTLLDSTSDITEQQLKQASPDSETAITMPSCISYQM